MHAFPVDLLLAFPHGSGLRSQGRFKLHGLVTDGESWRGERRPERLVFRCSFLPRKTDCKCLSPFGLHTRVIKMNVCDAGVDGVKSSRAEDCQAIAVTTPPRQGEACNTSCNCQVRRLRAFSQTHQTSALLSASRLLQMSRCGKPSVMRLFQKLIRAQKKCNDLLVFP